MKEDKNIKRLRKVEMVDDYLNQQHVSFIPKIYEGWQTVSQEISEIIKTDNIDTLQIAAVVDVLIKNMHYESQMHRYDKKSQQYKGALDLTKFLNEYQNKNAVPINIIIEYKTLYEKGVKTKKRSAEEYKKLPANTVNLEGRELIKLLMKNIALENLIKLTDVFSGYEKKPLFEFGSFPKKKIAFIVKQRKIALTELSTYFDLYSSIPLKIKKINCVKLLVYMGFLESYDEYKNKDRKKKLDKTLAENEYYLQRYSDIVKVRANNAEG